MFKNAKVFSSFSVNDLAAAKQFYDQTLGLEVAETPQGLQLSFQDGQEIFIYQKDNHTPATFTILNFLVDDIETAVDALVAKGVTFEHYDNMNQDEKGIARSKTPSDGPTLAWFKDPAGNVLAVLQQ